MLAGSFHSSRRRQKMEDSSSVKASVLSRAQPKSDEPDSVELAGPAAVEQQQIQVSEQEALRTVSLRRPPQHHHGAAARRATRCALVLLSCTSLAGILYASIFTPLVLAPSPPPPRSSASWWPRRPRR